MKVLLTGGRGQLGRDIALALSGRIPPGGTRASLHRPPGLDRQTGVELVAPDHATMPVDNRLAVLTLVSELRPDVIIHSAAMTAVDACESAPDTAFQVNALGTRHLAEAASRVGAHLVYISTDYVFDGRSRRPYREWDDPGPLSVYGRSKLAGERECPFGATIVRTAWLAGVSGANLVKATLEQGTGSTPLRFVDDQRGSPTFTADLAPAVCTLALERLPGVFHVTNGGEATRFEVARETLALSGGDPDRVVPITTAELDPPRAAQRPEYSVLDNAALRLSGLPLLPDWHEGLERLIAALGSPSVEGGTR